MHSTSEQVNIARQDGWSLFSAPEAMLKGVLESDASVELIAGPRSDSFAPLLDLVRHQTVSELLRMHGTALEVTPDAARAVTLAAARAVSGHRSLALVPNDDLDHAMPALARVCGVPLGDRGALGLILEDDPPGVPSCPRQAAARLDMTCLEAGSIEQLRDMMQQAIRMSRAGRAPVAVVVHRSLLRSADTIQARPNRVMDPVAAAAMRPQRRQRIAEIGDILRLARRFELNRTAGVPSPGERLPAGFIVVGPAAAAMEHLILVLGLAGRVPLLQLGLLHPMDGSIVERLLGRCEQVVVLEPRPGSVEAGVLRVSEAMRRRGERPALVGGVTLVAPPGSSDGLGPEDAIHPSILARRIIDLLVRIRPAIKMPFVPDPPELASRPRPRGDRIGASGALAQVRRALADVDQWLRDRAAGDDDASGAAALAIDGVEPEASVGQRVVFVETWSSRRFLEEGLASLRQAAWDERPFLLVICAVGARRTWRIGEAEEAQDLERLVRGSIPGPRADGARIETVDLNDRPAMQGLLRELIDSCPLGVIIARDGPPARFDVLSLQRDRAEIDRLGYEPRQRLVMPADEPCVIEAVPDASAAPASGEIATTLHTRMTVGRMPRRADRQPRLRFRIMLEQVEVMRARPPSFLRQDDPADRPPRPTPVHAAQSRWRAHLAGFRGDGPGVAAWTLGEAGRAMGYHVRCRYDPAPLGPGRRAWAQVLFTRPGRDERPPPMSVTVPYGEADLLLGLDYREALRAIDPEGSLRVANLDRTGAVVNLGAFSGEPPVAGPPTAAQAGAALRAVTRDGQRMLNDFAAACRAVFVTDRVTDFALVGAAFQRGLIPVSPEAMEEAVRRVETRGFGRAMEAFRFGCHAAGDERLLARPADTHPEDVDRLVRRMVLSHRCARWLGRVDMDHFARLLTRALAAMPGLTETDRGRTARRNFAMALERCLAWGGVDYARQYAELITDLYRADRGDKGREITRNAILPLADAMLIRDPLYVATMTLSPQQRRNARLRLNARPARGDHLERRFLTRLELLAFNRRLRLDLRTGERPARLAALFRKRVPVRWRGTMRERKIRDLVMDVVRRAVPGAGRDYGRWSETMRRLNEQARSGSLRGMAVSELQMLVEERDQLSTASG